MRLTQIKLAGFKSFVDPTSISVPGQLVGVVGPNGCGKSNIIDAVRWVLGESRASALRGDSMQDVIFNGSGNRNPVARASVELHFDNSLGKASGAWSQYAEIEVKRVLQRDGESNYFINNTHVRRRDVQDIFLGTGLGPRAYAIVEQGMISRIIEAKPEDLRVFLEEAAGISKYKERRRETEHRLSDTRENLARVTDILQELGAQIEKLEKQAEVARRFQELSADRDIKQNLLTLLRRNEARNEAQKHLAEIERTGLEVESETADLRNVEKRIEQIRSDHALAADALNVAQGELYQSNTEVSGLESEIRFLTETRQRVQAQLDQGRSSLMREELRSGELREAGALWQSQLEESGARLASAAEARLAEAEKLPQAEAVHRAAQDELAAQRTRIAETESSLDLEQTHAAHAEKTLQNLEARKQRLTVERGELAMPDSEALNALEQELEQGKGEIVRQQALLEQLEAARAGLEDQRGRAQEDLQALERELAAIDAKLITLQRIQRQSDENGKVDEWLERQGLLARPRLWQKLVVQEGWETAVESVLRERLHSLEIEDSASLQRLLVDPPPSRVMVHLPGNAAAANTSSARAPLSSLVQITDARLGEMVEGWFRGHSVIEGMPGLDERLGLAAEEVLVNRDGHQFSRYGVIFHAPDSVDSGILARQREIEGLIHEVALKRNLIDIARGKLADILGRLEEHLAAVSTLRAAGEALNRRHHEKQLQQVKRIEEGESNAQRFAQIALELEEIAGHEIAERVAHAAAIENALRMRTDLELLRQEAVDTARRCQDSGNLLGRQRDAVQLAAREEQDAGFAERECKTKISEIEGNLKSAAEQISVASQHVTALEQELSTLGDQLLQERLQGALETRSSREKSLNQARSLLDDLTERLRSADASRQQHELRLQPLRDKIVDLRLKEQAARLIYEQHAAQLVAGGADEGALSNLLKEGQRPAPLQGEITRLNNAIGELGAINMAALDEVVVNRERKQYLDAQFQDLAEALDILEAAIRRIDHETRELLQATFRTVNGHFGVLFPALFGGGEARLEMTGEEILDSGVQVIARPPGKKNSTIHLLSGGEKALTAIALVFAMFQLNPAPFCLLDEVDAPLDDANTVRFCELVSRMAEHTQFLFISHNKITMEMSNQLVGVTMQEQGVSRVVAVDIEEALKMREPEAA
jgi:chromosome segregation protein